MKKTILAIVLSVAMLVTCVLPAFADDEEWTWADDDYTVAQYQVVVVEEGTIKVDGVIDDAYLNSTKIESYPDDGYTRGGTESIKDIGKATFYSYIVADITGLFIFADIDDITIFETLDARADTGDSFNVYFDWTPEEFMHPTPDQRMELEASGESWDPTPYKSTYGAALAGMQYLGWLTGDYTGVVTGSAGFAPADQLGEDYEGVDYATVKREGGWTFEMFVPWRDSEQKEAIANGVPFHCSIGLGAADDADIDDTVTPGKEENTRCRYDQRTKLAGSYWFDYSMLADLVFVSEVTPPVITPPVITPPVGPGGDPVTPETSDSFIAVVAALAVAGTGVVLFAKKREN